MIFREQIKKRYGSKRGLLNSGIFSAQTFLGKFHKYLNVRTSASTRFVFICSGNICRSPLAEHVAKKMGAKAISFGLHTGGGDTADERAIKFAKSIGIDLTVHLTQNIKNYEPKEGDLLVGMEPAHAIELEKIFHAKVPVTLVGLWLPQKQAYIHDPYNTNDCFFNRCEQQVVDAVTHLVNYAARANGYSHNNAKS